VKSIVGANRDSPFARKILVKIFSDNFLPCGHRQPVAGVTQGDDTFIPNRNLL
jgi:hypothetical protein